MRLGILGGTFDPPHNGHLMFADEAIIQLGLDKVLFLLTPNPPHKEGKKITDVGKRLEMLKLAIPQNSSYEISYVDFNRPAPHFTVDTIKLLKQAHAEDEIIFLMGGDSLMDLPDIWKSPKEFVNRCDGLGVFRRSGVNINMQSLEELLPGITEKTMFLNSAQIDVSSTFIRNESMNRRSVREFVPELVNKFIEEQQLFSVVR